MTQKINKTQLFKMAHAMVRKATFETFGEALRKAWQVLKLRATMFAGKVEFAYRKTDGAVRKAIGTLCNINYTPAPLAPGKVRREKPIDQICYFDVEKNAFRSFMAASLI